MNRLNINAKLLFKLIFNVAVLAIFCVQSFASSIDMDSKNLSHLDALPYSIPGTPTNTSATFSSGTLTISFTSPTTGSTPTGYEYSLNGTIWNPITLTQTPSTPGMMGSGTAAVASQPVSITFRAVNDITPGMATGSINVNSNLL